MKSILLSIIIPCYNMEKYVTRCYNSLINQQDANDVEFIFINDGSKDNTLELLKRIQKEDERVVVIDQENAGVSNARNRALEIIRGKYVYLLDADDYLPCNVIQNIKDILCQYNPDILLPAYNISKNGVETFVPIQIREGLYNKYDLFSKLICFPTANQLIYRSDIINSYIIRFNSFIKCGEVYDFTINYLKYVNWIFVLNKPCFNYFQRADSATHNINYENDMTVEYAINSIYGNGRDLVKCSAFPVTSFRLWIYFTYLKYAHLKYSPKAKETILYMLSSNVIKRNIKDVIKMKHNSIKDRYLAFYLFIMPKTLGFKIINLLLICRDKLKNNNKL